MRTVSGHGILWFISISNIESHLNFCAGTPAMSSIASSSRRWFSLIVNAPMSRSARISVVTCRVDRLIDMSAEHVRSKCKVSQKFCLCQSGYEEIRVLTNTDATVSSEGRNARSGAAR